MSSSLKAHMEMWLFIPLEETPTLDVDFSLKVLHPVMLCPHHIGCDVNPYKNVHHSLKGFLLNPKLSIILNIFGNRETYTFLISHSDKGVQNLTNGFSK